jgi:hypothetical protein
MDGLSTIQHRIHELRGQRVMLDFDLAQLYGVETKRLNEQVKRNIERFPEDFMFQLTRGEWEILKSQIATSRLEAEPLRSQNATLETLRSQNATANSYDNQGDIVLRSQIATSKQAEKRGGKQYLPYAFTEQGVAMLSSVLRSPQAIQVNIGIMRAFTAMRHALNAIDLPAKVQELEHTIRDLKLDIEDCLRDQNEINEDTRAQLDAIATALAELQSKEPPQRPRRKIGFE